MLRRHRCYLATVAGWLGVIWLSVLAYMMLVPENYTSHFTLILPGSGAGSTLNVESIGQAQSAASSAFASPTLSPTENYKRLLMSDIVRLRAARLAKESSEMLPMPTIKLVDQTNLIEVEVEGSNPVVARRDANALREAFLEQLEILRRDEAKEREETESRNLTALERKVRDAQKAVLDFQAATGLVSLEQFDNRIATLDSLKQKRDDAKVALAAKTAETGRYSSILGTGTARANLSLRLQSDPEVQELARRLGQAQAEVTEAAANLGDNHGDLVALRARRDELESALARRGKTITGLNRRAVLDMLDLSVGNGRSNLMQAMAVANAETASASAALAQIRRNIQGQTAESAKLVEQASRLADLQRDHSVAEAVFSSALARIDTNKQDPFASYPLVQTLENPTLPEAPSTPSLVIGLAFGVLASLLFLIGLALLWFRQPIIRKIIPKF